MITLNNDGMFKSNWFIDKVTVEKEVEGGSEKYEFPCYRWDSHHLVVYEGKGKTTYGLGRREYTIVICMTSKLKFISVIFMKISQ